MKYRKEAACLFLEVTIRSIHTFYTHFLDSLKFSEVLPFFRSAFLRGGRWLYQLCSFSACALDEGVPFRPYALSNFVAGGLRIDESQEVLVLDASAGTRLLVGLLTNVYDRARLLRCELRFSEARPFYLFENPRDVLGCPAGWFLSQYDDDERDGQH